jgi:hypothetical protein
LLVGWPAGLVREAWCAVCAVIKFLPAVLHRL